MTKTISRRGPLLLVALAFTACHDRPFDYAFDCGDGSGYGAFGASNTASCLTSGIGTRTVKGKVKDQEGDQTEYTGSVAVIYPFGGFVGPVDPVPVLNVAKAGSAIPLRFSLGGNRGLNILAAGYPISQTSNCSASSSTDLIEQTVTAGNSSLSYDAATNEYTYVWKTNKNRVSFRNHVPRVAATFLRAGGSADHHGGHRIEAP